MGVINRIRNLRNKITHRPVIVESKYVNPFDEHKSKRAIVIGGTSGIGQAIAKRLKQAGCDVIIAGRHKNTEEFDFFEWDVSKIGDISNKFKEVVDQYGAIDYVINSQGLNPHYDLIQDFMNIDNNDFEDVFRINVESVYFICIEAFKYFIENNIKGHILNICSTEGLRAGVVPYGISKASVISLTRGFGREFGRKGIVCNGIAPGTTATKMIGYKGDLSNETQVTGRMNTTEEIANLASFMLADTGMQMNGEVIVMDGGATLR